VRFANVDLDYNMTGSVPPLEYGDAKESAIQLLGQSQCNTSTRLFVFVPTRPSSFTVREIRRSWAADLVLSLFMLLSCLELVDGDVGFSQRV